SGVFHDWGVARRASLAQRSKRCRVPSCYAGGALGRLALFRTFLVIASEPHSEHVYADWTRHGRRVSRQRRGHFFPADLPGFFSRYAWRRARLFRSVLGDIYSVFLM